jgi:probable rRNA maturation factor
MVEVNNKTRSRIDLKLVKKVARNFLKYYNTKRRLTAIPSGKSNRTNVNNIEVSIALVGDKTMRRLNKTYRGRKEDTDVLVFPGEDDFLGEIIINWAQIKKQAKRYSPNIEKELVFVLVHGLLHLLGYEDKMEKGRKEMERQGKEFISKLKM